MLSRFREVDQAIAYLCEGVDAWMGSGRAVIAWYPGGTREPHHTLVDVPQLISTLQRYCRKFPGATAVVDVTREDAPIFGLQCRCSSDRRQTCPGHCKSHADRPTVCVFKCQDSAGPSIEQQQAFLAALQEVVRKRLAEDQGLPDANPHHHHKEK